MSLYIKKHIEVSIVNDLTKEGLHISIRRCDNMEFEFIVGEYSYFICKDDLLLLVDRIKEMAKNVEL
jgi:hypothetical protein